MIPFKKLDLKTELKIKFMKERLKNKMLNEFVSKLTENHPELSEYTIRTISSELSNVANDIHLANNDGLGDLLNNAINDLETHRKEFQDHIQFLQKNTTKILEILKSKALVYYDSDPKTNKNVLVGRTNVLTEVVSFMNILNNMVISYYKDVYKIQQNEDKTTQTSLF